MWRRKSVSGFVVSWEMMMMQKKKATNVDDVLTSDTHTKDCTQTWNVRRTERERERRV